MTSNLLLVAGIFVLSLALRSVTNPIIHRIGTLGVLFTSFLVGWLLIGELWIGVALAFSWLLLPWLEILTRVRRMRIPFDRRLKDRTPPNRMAFPNLSELTDAIEGADFEYLDDIGWDWDNYSQFFRIFGDEKKGTQAAICLIEQDELAFFYLSISSRMEDGTVYMTWNYPFSYALKTPPRLKLNRVGGELDFQALLREHASFLEAQGRKPDEAKLQTPEEIRSEIENDIRTQMRFNIDRGLLEREGKDLIRYSIRGMLFLWLQFLRDFVRLS